MPKNQIFLKNGKNHLKRKMPIKLRCPQVARLILTNVCFTVLSGQHSIQLDNRPIEEESLKYVQFC